MASASGSVRHKGAGRRVSPLAFHTLMVGVRMHVRVRLLRMRIMVDVRETAGGARSAAHQLRPQLLERGSIRRRPTRSRGPACCCGCCAGGLACACAAPLLPAAGLALRLGDTSTARTGTALYTTPGLPSRCPASVLVPASLEAVHMKIAPRHNAVNCHAMACKQFIDGQRLFLATLPWRDVRGILPGGPPALR